VNGTFNWENTSRARLSYRCKSCSKVWCSFACA